MTKILNSLSHAKIIIYYGFRESIKTNRINVSIKQFYLCLIECAVFLYLHIPIDIKLQFPLVYKYSIVTDFYKA